MAKPTEKEEGKPKTLEEMAKKVVSIKDVAKRSEATLSALKDYERSYGVAQDLEAKSEQLARDIMENEKVKALWDNVMDTYKKSEGRVEYNTVTDWVRKFSDLIMPMMKVGAENSIEENYGNLRMYMDKFDEINNRRSETTIKEIRELLAKGRFSKALVMAAEAIEEVKNRRRKENFVEMVLPPEDYEFRDAASKLLADKLNKELSERGEKVYKVSPSIIALNLPTTYELYAAGETQRILSYAGIRQKEKKEKVVKGEFGAGAESKAA